MIWHQAGWWLLLPILSPDADARVTLTLLAAELHWLSLDTRLAREHPHNTQSTPRLPISTSLYLYQSFPVYVHWYVYFRIGNRGENCHCNYCKCVGFWDGLIYECMCSAVVINHEIIHLNAWVVILLMIFYKKVMVLFSLHNVSKGKDYLVEVEEGNYNKNKFVFTSKSSSYEVQPGHALWWLFTSGLWHGGQDCQLATALPLGGVSKQAESDPGQWVKPITAQRSVPGLYDNCELSFEFCSLQSSTRSSMAVMTGTALCTATGCWPAPWPCSQELSWPITSHQVYQKAKTFVIFNFLIDSV